MIEEWLNLELPDDEIILISRYINFAESCYNYGIFIDSNGGVYSFEFSQGTYQYNRNETDEDFLKKLHTIRNYAEPFLILDSNILKELYSYLYQINSNATFDEKLEVFDMGEKQLMVCKVDTNELILCSETGDYSGMLKDT